MAIARMLPTNLFFIPEFSKLYESAKLAYIGLILHVDDEGRGFADTRTLSRAIDSYDSQVDASLKQLHETGLIHIYEVEGKQYYQITNWSDMQQGLRYKHPSLLPPPPVSEHAESNSTQPATVNENHSADVVDVVEKESNNNNTQCESETEKASTEPEPETTITTDTENQNHQTATPKQSAESTPPSRSSGSSGSEGSEENITTTTSSEVAQTPNEGTLMSLLGCSQQAARDLIVEFPTINLLDMEDKVPRWLEAWSRCVSGLGCCIQSNFARWPRPHPGKRKSFPSAISDRRHRSSSAIWPSMINCVAWRCSHAAPIKTPGLSLAHPP